MAGAAPSAKPAPFLRPIDLFDRGLLLAESALSLVIVSVMVLVAVIESATHLVSAVFKVPSDVWEHNAFTHYITHSGADIVLHGTIWAAFLGASFATRGRKHLAIDVLGRLLPERGRHALVGVSSTLGALVAGSLSRGIYLALITHAHEANEAHALDIANHATDAVINRTYEFDFVIPAGFALISMRLFLHAYHEFAAAIRGLDPVVAAHAASTHVAGVDEPASNARDMVDPAHAAPVDHASGTEIAIACAVLASMGALGLGRDLGMQLFTATGLALLTLAIPAINRYRRTQSFAAPVASEAAAPVKWTAGQLVGGAAGVAVVAGAASLGMANVATIPVAYGVAFFAIMAILGAPLFTFLGGMALFLFMHGAPEAQLPARTLPVAVEDVFGTHFARSSVLSTIPMFTLAGYLMSESRTPQRLVRVARAWLGWMPGGLAVVCLIASAFFTVFSGASGITIVAIGGLLFPALIRDKYPEKFSLGLVTTGGALGITFPPSLPLIVYGIVAGLQEPAPGQERLDLNKFLFAGILPGVLLIVLISVYSVVMGVVREVPRSKFDTREAFAAFWEAKWEFLLGPAVFIGFVTGVFNPSQLAAFTAFYVLIIEVFVYKDLVFARDLPRIVPESMILVGAIFVKLCAASVLTAYFVDAKTADHLFEALTCGRPAQDYLAAHSDLGECRLAVDALMSAHQSAGGLIQSKITFLIALNVFLLVVGMLMDIFSAIVVIVPLIAGIALHFNINPYHLGIVFLLNLEIGYLMPPMGLNLFIAGFRFNRPVPDLYRTVAPFILLFIATLMVTTYVPALTLAMVPGAMAAQQAAEHPPPVVVAPTGSAPDANTPPPTPAGQCDVPEEGESFEAFTHRCEASGDGGAAPPAEAVPADCDVPNEGESMAQFKVRCHIADEPDGAATP